MRIVGGAWRGRSIAAPTGDRTRPTSDRVREAVFSALAARLGADVGGGPVLDAFAGSGALGLEALSRGASRVTFVDADRAALAALRANVAALGAAERSTVIAGDVFSLADRRIRERHSLILLDPPYTLEATRVGGLLVALVRNGACGEGTTVVWEHASDKDADWPPGFCLITQKRYGSTVVDFAEFEGEAGE